MAPIGRTEAGLPIGVQIIGPYLEDPTPIQFAQLLEQAFGGFVPLMSTRLFGRFQGGNRPEQS